MLPPLGGIESFIPSMCSNRPFKLASTHQTISSALILPLFFFSFFFTQAMQTTDRNVQSLGICQRLFNLVMNSLIARGFRRITAVGPRSCHSNELPAQESTSRNGEQPTIPNGEKGIASSEILVEFRHANGMDNWTAVDKLDSLVMVTDEDSPGIMKPHKREMPQAQDRAGSQVQGKDLKEPEPLTTTTKDHAKGPKKSVSIRENRGEKETSNSIPTEKPPPTVEPEDRKMKPQGHHVRPLLNVVPNINEKSEAFISSRKKAMSRNLSHEQKKS